MEKVKSQFQALFAETVSPHSLALFRIVFGALMVWNVTVSLLREIVFFSFTAANFRFSYPLLDWVQPLPGRGMEVLWLFMALAAVGITVGLFYRFSAAFFALAFTYSFLLDSTNYTNADYLVILVSLILIFVPAHSAYSFDNVIRKRGPSEVRRVWLVLLAFQFAILYVCAGIAKINGDWISGGPLTIILATQSDFPLLGPLFALPLTGLILSWFALFFDLTIVFWAMWRRTRLLAFLVALSFHGLNSQLFAIGYFPWMSLAGLTLFFSSSWPQNIMRRIGRGNGPALSGVNAWSKRRTSLASCIILIYVAVQALVPFRHYIVGDNFAWDDNGNMFAWHMITSYREGTVGFEVKDRSGKVLYEGPAYDLLFLQRANLIGRPNAIRQYAHHLAEVERDKNDLSYLPSVYVYAPVSLNGRPRQLLIDPTVDMSDQPAYIFNPPYINDLAHPLPPRDELLRYGLTQ